MNQQTLSLAEVDPNYLRQLFVMFKHHDLPIDHPMQPTQSELSIFAQYCAANGHDPLGKEIYFIKDKKKGKIHYQVSIDGLRGRSESSGEFLGRVGPMWIDKNGNWHDFWILDEAPAGCKVGILRKGYSEPVWGFARFASYCQSRESWSNWGKMPEVMIAKCAEAQAHRAAFPKNCAKLYVAEEMAEIVESEVLAEIKPKAPVKKFGSPVVTPELAEKSSVQGPTQEPAEPVTEEQPEEDPADYEYQPEEERSPDAATDEEFETIRRATGLFGGRILEAVRKEVEEPTEIPFSLDPLDDNEEASDAYVQEAWSRWEKVYGRGVESRDKLISIGVKTLQGKPPKKYPRLMLEHLNALTQEAKF